MKKIDLKLEGGCQTTAMGIMPHRDADRALRTSFNLALGGRVRKSSVSGDLIKIA